VIDKKNEVQLAKWAALTRSSFQIDGLHCVPADAFKAMMHENE